MYNFFAITKKTLSAQSGILTQRNMYSYRYDGTVKSFVSFIYTTHIFFVYD